VVHKDKGGLLRVWPPGQLPRLLQSTVLSSYEHGMFESRSPKRRPDHDADGRDKLAIDVLSGHLRICLFVRRGRREHRCAQATRPADGRQASGHAAVLAPESAVVRVAGLVVVGEDLERRAAAGMAGLEVAAGHFLGGCPVAAFGEVGAGRGGGDVGVDADGVQLVRLAEAVVAAGGCQARVDVGMGRGDGGGVQVLIVGQEDVVCGCQPFSSPQVNSSAITCPAMPRRRFSRCQAAP
jgi:hypothetical protein